MTERTSSARDDRACEPIENPRSGSLLRRRFGLFLVAVAVAVAGVNAAAPWGHEIARWTDNALQLVAGAAAVGCGLIAARTQTGAQRWWRLAIVAAMVSWFAGQLLRVWYRLADGRDVRSPSLVDLGYLGFALGLLAALLVLARSNVSNQRSGRRFDATAAIEGFVVTGALFILFWMAALRPALHVADPNPAASVFALAYPITDLVMIVAAVLLIVLDAVDRRSRPNLILLTAGIIAFACSDSFFVHRLSPGRDDATPASNIGFVLGPVLIACAVQAHHQRSDRFDGLLNRWRLLLPYVLVLVVFTVFTVRTFLGGFTDIVAGGAALPVAVLAGTRLALSMRENRRLLLQVLLDKQQLQHQAAHDPLTGLANRALFAERLDRARGQGDARLVVIFLDLDDFTEVNNRFGHAGGDVVLRAVATRLRTCVDSTDTAARIGGDEFALLIDCQATTPQAAAEQLRVALHNPFLVHGCAVSVRASMGLAVVEPGDPPVSADELLGRADTSMYAGKRLGKDVAVTYGASPAAWSEFSRALSSASGGIPQGFSLAYQPIVRLSDRVPVAVEALARWTTPDGTSVPSEFLVASVEGDGLGMMLDALVIDLACREVAAAGLDIAVHVNISATALGAPALEEAVTAALQNHRIRPGMLVLEITETVPIGDLDLGAAAIRRLRAQGVRMALDDFGAGHNSLMSLHKLPVDIVKLDRSLIADIGSNPGRPLVASLIRLCTEMHVDVVVEGVETAEQADRIGKAGATVVQGYWFGYPAPLSALSATAGQHDPRIVLRSIETGVGG